MQKTLQQLTQDLNHKDVNTRLNSLRKLIETVNEGKIDPPAMGNDVNNHIHTTYSFSPYSPTKAIWMAYNAGLKTAGIMDHDSISGAREFIEAGKIVGISTTIGVECRSDFSKTALSGRRINNPDQKSNAYIALHGIPHTKIDAVKDYFKPYLAERIKRNIQMTERINKITEPFGIAIDFERDVKPLSNYEEGGSITERHLLYALSAKITKTLGRGQKVVDFLKNKLGINPSSKALGYLLDEGNPYYEYDLLGVLKSDMVEMFYIDAVAECPDVRQVISFCSDIGAISAYAYLGDVGDSVTGDKKSQKFEDDYLDELFDVLKELKFNAVTYMPSRNTISQLRRVKELCKKHGLLEISGEDINSPRQSFVCEAMRNPEFANLYESTWALIGHEKAATEDIENGMFSKKTLEKYPDLNERIRVYGKIGREGQRS